MFIELKPMFLLFRRFLIAPLVGMAFLFPLHPAFSQTDLSTLDNGLRVIVSQSHAVPIVAIDAWVRAGIRRETPGEEGVAHFLEHVVFKGTPSHPTEESIDGAVEDLGGSFDAATSYDWAHFYTVVPSQDYRAALAVLADVLQNSTITSSAVEDERSIIESEIARNQDDPQQSLVDLSRTMAYSNSDPYARPVTGSADQVRSITQEQVLKFYKTYYVPNNTTLILSGDIGDSDGLLSAHKYFDDWKRSDTLPEDVAAGQYKSATPSVQRQLVQKDSNQSYLVMAFPAPAVSSGPDPWIMDVLLTLLGQGANNRLQTALKVAHPLCNDIEADYLTQRDPGLLTISASVPTANLQAVEDEILAQVNDLRDHAVSDNEIEAAKTSLKSSYLFQTETDSGRADSLGFYDSIDSYLYDTQYVDHVASVTPTDLQRVAKKYLTVDNYVLVEQDPPTDAENANAVLVRPPMGELVDHGAFDSVAARTGR